VPPEEQLAEDVDEQPSAPWTDAARTEEEWVDAAHSEGWTDADWGGVEWADTRAMASGTAPTEHAPDDADQTVPTPYLTSTEPPGPNAVRLALGLATMAAQRLRGGVPVGDGFVTGIGGTLKGAALLPLAGLPIRAAAGSRRRITAAVTSARARGHQTLEAGRADAEHLLTRGAERTLHWAREHALPPLVDQLAPQLAEQVAPRLAAGSTTPADARDLPYTAELSDLSIEEHAAAAWSGPPTVDAAPTADLSTVDELAGSRRRR
jgi:hypothetical protein